MSQAERIKEALGWLKIVFGALVAVDVSLVAWLTQNFRTAEAIMGGVGCRRRCRHHHWHRRCNAAFRLIAQLEDL